MMEILRGSPALSAFRINKLLARFQAARLPVSNIYAEYVHFADVNDRLNEEELTRLQRLLKYGPNLSSHTPTGKLLLVTPRPGTISPGLLKQRISRTTATLAKSIALSAAWPTMLRPQR
jgi:phosphoribosylformylglycinamidine synthase